MNVLIILGHPDKKSFNHAIAKTCIRQIENNGHTVYFHDLYAEKFSPLHHIDNENEHSVLDEAVTTHCTHLKNCDGIIVIHPNWWGQPPAIIKGWLDRVLLPGVAYHFVLNAEGAAVPIGLLQAKFGLVFTTSNTPDAIENDELDSIWKNRVFAFCGVKKTVRRNFGLVKKSDEKQRSGWLLEVQALVNSRFPMI